MNQGCSPAHVASIIATEKLLELIIRSPGNYKGNNNIVRALESQSKLSAYSNSDLGIVTMSLNAQKRAANAHIVGEFAAIDALRVRAKAVLATSREKLDIPKARTRKALAEINNQYSDEIIAILQDCMQLEGALDLIIETGRGIVEEIDDLALKQRWKKNLAVVYARQSLAVRYKKHLHETKGE